MSSISVNTITDASGGATTSINGFTPSVSNMAGRNRIINGGMMIDQRNAGASVTASVVGGFTYLVDRFGYQASAGSKFTAQQNAGSVTPPVGFTNYLGITSSSAYSVTASDYFFLSQPIEGFNTADLNWGTANAKTITLSFWVYSSLTGTFGGSIVNSGYSAYYSFPYTISSANTWTQISVTIAGDTAGTWIGATNGVGLRVMFSLGAGSTYSGTANTWVNGSSWVSQPTGSVSVVGTSGATFYITGVQLEAGSVATPFEHRQYGTELQLCRRYYINTDTANHYGYTNNFGGNDARFSFPVTMRTAPSVTTSNTAGSLNSSSPVDFTWNRTTVITSYTASAEL